MAAHKLPATDKACDKTGVLAAGVQADLNRLGEKLNALT